MKDFNPEPSDPVRVTIPRLVYDRITVLLVGENGGEKVSDVKVEGYIVSVLEGHARGLRL